MHKCAISVYDAQLRMLRICCAEAQSAHMRKGAAAHYAHRRILRREELLCAYSARMRSLCVEAHCMRILCVYARSMHILCVYVHNMRILCVRAHVMSTCTSYAYPRILGISAHYASMRIVCTYDASPRIVGEDAHIMRVCTCTAQMCVLKMRSSAYAQIMYCLLYTSDAADE